tara:strand:+ start:196 stop:639 length:444 start_codon:yes stop_codon:yes gene_type:complete
MQVTMFLLLCFMMLFMTYQDLKFRGISWLLFPVVFALLLFHRWDEIYLHPFDLGLNLAFLLMIILLQYIYFNLFRKKSIKSMIGLGDILFFPLIAVALSNDHFLLFFPISLIITLLVSAFTRMKKIPLAGIQAALLTSVLVFLEVSK